MDQQIVELYDEYTHRPLPRRMFLDRLARLVGGAAAISAILPLLENDYARAAVVPEGDPRIAAARTSYSGASGEVRAYLAMPAGGGGPRGAVVVIHENRGLNPHIEDIARRLAAEGFLALAPDALSPLGGTPPDQDAARAMTRKLDRAQAVADFVAAVGFLGTHRLGNGRAGCVGFCWGGGVANQLAVASDALSAAVSYYGRQPPADQVPKIAAPLLLHYAGLDARVNAGIDAFVGALRTHGKTFEMHLYEGANHAFNNDTNAARYDRNAAQLAWGRTVSFLRRHLAA